MAYESHDWLVFHHVAFSSNIDGTGKPFPSPKNAAFRRFYPSSPVGPNGMRTNVSRHRGGFGLYRSRQAAQDVFDAPENHLGFLEQATEAFHALVLPVSHRGEVDWSGELRDDKAMMKAAYKSGHHKSQLDVHSQTPMCDRTSLTRARILDAKGSWNGANPVSELT